MTGHIESRKRRWALEAIPCLNRVFGSHWTEVVRAYGALMADVMPCLTPAQQSVYQRLFRPSHDQERPFTKCRDEDVAAQSGLSLSTLRRAVKRLRMKTLIKAVRRVKFGASRPPVYDAFSDDRTLFVSCKQHLG